LLLNHDTYVAFAAESRDRQLVKVSFSSVDPMQSSNEDVKLICFYDINDLQRARETVHTSITRKILQRAA